MTEAERRVIEAMEEAVATQKAANDAKRRLLAELQMLRIERGQQPT